jgi:hypothetical protein
MHNTLYCYIFDGLYSFHDTTMIKIELGVICEKKNEGGIW